MSGSLTLIVSGLTVEEIKQILKHVREIEQTNPQRLIFCEVKGMEHKSFEEALKIMQEIFPEKPAKEKTVIPVE